MSRQNPPQFTGQAGSFLRKFLYELEAWWINELSLQPGTVTPHNLFDRVLLAFPYETPAQIWWCETRDELKRTTDPNDASIFNKIADALQTEFRNLEERPSDFLRRALFKPHKQDLQDHVIRFKKAFDASRFPQDEGCMLFLNSLSLDTLLQDELRRVFRKELINDTCTVTQLTDHALLEAKLRRRLPPPAPARPDRPPPSPRAHATAEDATCPMHPGSAHTASQCRKLQRLREETSVPGVPADDSAFEQQVRQQAAQINQLKSMVQQLMSQPTTPSHAPRSSRTPDAWLPRSPNIFDPVSPGRASPFSDFCTPQAMATTKANLTALPPETIPEEEPLAAYATKVRSNPLFSDDDGGAEECAEDAVVHDNPCAGPNQDLTLESMGLNVPRPPAALAAGGAYVHAASMPSVCANTRLPLPFQPSSWPPETVAVSSDSHSRRYAQPPQQRESTNIPDEPALLKMPLSVWPPTRLLQLREKEGNDIWLVSKHKASDMRHLVQIAAADQATASTHASTTSEHPQENVATLHHTTVVHPEHRVFDQVDDYADYDLCASMTPDVPSSHTTAGMQHLQQHDAATEILQNRSHSNSFDNHQPATCTPSLHHTAVVHPEPQVFDDPFPLEPDEYFNVALHFKPCTAHPALQARSFPPAPGCHLTHMLPD